MPDRCSMWGCPPTFSPWDPVNFRARRAGSPSVELPAGHAALYSVAGNACGGNAGAVGGAPYWATKR
eukprot:7011817-Pyramimonas_sp.AAC.1